MAVTNKKSSKLKEPVRVRTKKLADGSESYYLDIYVNGNDLLSVCSRHKYRETSVGGAPQNRSYNLGVKVNF